MLGFPKPTRYLSLLLIESYRCQPLFLSLRGSSEQADKPHLSRLLSMRETGRQQATREVVHPAGQEEEQSVVREGLNEKMGPECRP